MAQAPSRMSYQSVVRNSGGQLVTNASVSIRITILQGSANGNITYIETHSKTSNDNGLVSLEIGGGTVVLGTFSSINWATGPYFLKTETDPAGGSNYAISGISQLLSVPYALYAEKSGNINDWITTTNGIYYPSPKNVGIRTPATSTTAFTVMGETNGTGSSVALFTSNDTWQSALSMRNNFSQYTFVVGGPNNLELQPNNFGIANLNRGASKAIWPLTINNMNNFIGIGHPDGFPQPAKSTLHVLTGDVHIKSVGNGIIMKSPNGQCWRVTVSNTGTFISTLITCP